jgi:peptide/nickel transport system substrate-binding protein
MQTNYWDRVIRSRVTRRRTLLAAGGFGLGAAALALSGCGGDDDSGGTTASTGGSPTGSSSTGSSTGSTGASTGGSSTGAVAGPEPGKVWFASNNWTLSDETAQAVAGGVFPGQVENDNDGGFDAIIANPASVPFYTHIYEGPMGTRRAPGVDPASAEATVPIPVLAQGMELADAGATITFTMRPGVKFHPVAPVNGRVMDIEDWKTTLERFLELSPQRSFLEDLLDRAEYPDANHMVLKLKYPYAPFIDTITNQRFYWPILPKESNADPDGLSATTVAGTGFKILDEYQPAVAMKYRKHADYWGDEPFIDRWNFPIIPEYSNRYAQFVAGNVAAFTPSPSDALKLQKDAPGAVMVGQQLLRDRIRRFNFGEVGAETAPYKDARVRIAMRRSIDWEGIVAVQSNRAEFEASGIQVETAINTHATRDAAWWLDPASGGLGDLSSNYIYDPAEAKKLNAAAGFSDKIEIPYTVLLSSDGQEPEVERLMIDSMNQSGNFTVNAKGEGNRNAARDCYSLRKCAGIMSTGNGEYFMDYFLREQHSGGNRDGGAILYPDPEIDRIADAYRKAVDVEDQIALIQEYQKFQAGYFSMIPILHEFTAFTFRYPWMHNIAWGTGSSETLSNLDNQRATWGAHKVWLASDMPNRNG